MFSKSLRQTVNYMAIDVTTVLALAGFAIGAWKAGKFGVAEGILALLGITLATVGKDAVATIAAAIPIVGMIVPAVVTLIASAAVGGIVVIGAKGLLHKVGVKL